jgi:hypothetical protein
METAMTEITLLRQLRKKLEHERLHAIEELASEGKELSDDWLQRIAMLQTALAAVNEELNAHSVRLGGGDEQPFRDA